MTTSLTECFAGLQDPRVERLTPITFILSTVSDKDPSAKLLFYSGSLRISVPCK